ncbi:MAG: alpha/beta fold hydrolase [Bacteroidetes bacterium]|nr:alpha/beta fold hydrolase [Bacteroidota bacterium]HET6245506.1 alpha/beta fold hydrolase [Bacteroidia bacterium]
MKLNFKKLGSGKPLIILHGLFGSLDNWQTIGKQFAEKFTVYLVDQRNHGQSPHNVAWDYQVMVDDLDDLIHDENIQKPILIGHSMGGKTAMLYANQKPEKIAGLVVVDIAPKQYDPHHEHILKALNAVDLDKITTRKEAEDILSDYIKDSGTKQFLLKSLYWNDLENKKLDWRFNRKVISENIATAGLGIQFHKPLTGFAVLFIAGGKSDYITEKDHDFIKKMFPEAEIKTIENAGHWVHAEAPVDFYSIVFEFIESRVK